MDSRSFVAASDCGFVAYLGGERLGCHEYQSEAEQHYVNAIWSRNTMSQTACIRAHEMVQSFSHTRPDGSAWWTVLPEGQRMGTLEVAGWGYDNLKDVIVDWEASPAHAAIMRYSVREIGICWWTDIVVVQGRL